MFLNDWIKCYRTYASDKYNQNLRKEIVFHRTPTIIANNCIGGVIYHNLGLQFNSPTINLYLENDDFLLFVSHLKEFVSGKFVEIDDEGKNFPIGQLTCQYGKVKIYFQHYKDFKEAVRKWEQRVERIDWENLVLIMEEGKNTSDEIVNRFETLPYKRKVLICNGNAGHVAVKNGYPMFIYDDKYYPGKILSFGRFKISKKRYLDEFDYVEFLNSGQIRKKTR